MKTFHTKLKQLVFKAFLLDTPLGSMLAIADDTYLLMLKFIEQDGLEREFEKLRKKWNAEIRLGTTKPITSIQEELKSYFDGTLKEFQTPLRFFGSEFQKSVWNALVHIPYDATKSYSELANEIGKNTAYRAVANANAANQLAIVVPCHRIINKNGELGGYNGGVERKKWLLQHENCNV